MFGADWGPPDFVASGLSTLLRECHLSGTYTRSALLGTAPFLFSVSLVSPCLSLL